MSMDKTKNDVISHGWHVVKVLGDDMGPGFGYSIGLYKTFGHPEVIIIGLKLDLIHTLINNIGEEIKNGKAYNPNEPYLDVLDDYKCYFCAVNKEFYDEYVMQAISFYGNDEFPLLQCIYPTLKGIYPWETNWPHEIKDLQPVLGNLQLTN